MIGITRCVATDSTQRVMRAHLRWTSVSCGKPFITRTRRFSLHHLQPCYVQSPAALIDLALRHLVEIGHVRLDDLLLALEDRYLRATGGTREQGTCVPQARERRIPFDVLRRQAYSAAARAAAHAVARRRAESERTHPEWSERECGACRRAPHTSSADMEVVFT